MSESVAIGKYTLQLSRTELYVILDALEGMAACAESEMRMQVYMQVFNYCREIAES